ncbi:MAG: Hsp20/alpha crystallin family protein [Patescibacteria group bacterium]
MAKEKRSFFEKLTGSVKVDPHLSRSQHTPGSIYEYQPEEQISQEIVNEDAELTVDVFQTADSIIIKTMAAGVNPDDLEIDITRDMVTIRGTRQEDKQDEHADHFIQELYWGSFSRSITLPEEIEVEEARAEEKHGLLTITLPKIDKHKKTKLKIRSN